MGYINAEEAIEELYRYGFVTKETIATNIRAIPSIDLVRCKECRHWNEEDHWCNIRDSYGWDYKADDYCSYGCREEE